MRFVSLHHHTTFSYLDGYGTPEQHAERAGELGMEHFFVTEHGNVSSHVRTEMAAKKVGIKAGFGCELYHGPTEEERRQRKKNHLTVLAQTQAGYQNLLRLVTRGWAEGFYYEPTVSGPMLAEHSDGLIVLSGCTASLLTTSLIGGKNIETQDASYARARKVAQRFKDVFGDRYFLEVQAIPELESVCSANQAFERLSRELGIPLVATLDVHYPKRDDSSIRQILHGNRPGRNKNFDEVGQEFDYSIDASPAISDRNVYDRLLRSGLSKAAAKEAVLQTEAIAASCAVTLPQIKPLHYPLPQGVDAVQHYWTLLRQGWRERGLDKLAPKERKRYGDRVKYESGLVIEKGFVDYFLVISDMVRFAKDRGIAVGPARGSAAASLVCYLLRITEVNPMLFPTLVFERFIDKTRHDLPDIDLDFDDDRRHEVREYLVAKYGSDRVGNIGTFTKYKGKNSLEDVQRVFRDRIPPYEVARVKDLLLERSSGDLRAAATIEDTVEMFEEVKDIFKRHPELWMATSLEGNMRGMSVHAAGLVVANEPLTNACAVYSREDKDGNRTEVLSVDKYDAEYLNVLKIDALGLKTMAVINIALGHIGMTIEELYALPLDDPEVLRGFQENDVVGIFQFDGRAMRSVNGGVVPDNFMEICDVNALARPGPLHSGATAEYIDIKHGRKPAQHFHPIVDRITKWTNYQVVYQEQILQVVRELGGFSWEEAAAIRKIISKKRGEQEFNQQRGKFIKGAAKHGMTEAEADTVWKMLVTAGAYAFNSAHCVSYGMLAYWTMWIKRKHPEAFFVGALHKYASDKDKFDHLLRDTQAHGRRIPILPPDLNASASSWTLEGGKALRAGFTQVPGIGLATAQAILEARDHWGFNEWEDLLKIKGIGPKTLDTILSFVRNPDPFNLELLKSKREAVIKDIKRGKLARRTGDPLPLPTHRTQDVPYDRGRDEEVVWLGIIRERNYKDLFELHHSRTGENLDPGTVKDPELVNWIVMLGEDDSGDLLTITVDRWRWPAFKDLVWSIDLKHDLVLIRGVKKGFQARRAIYVTEMWVIDPE